jgi:CRP-like cAMP-binding protein
VPSIARAPPVNRLIDALPSGERSRMLAGCEPVELALADVLCASGEAVRHVYFPVRSLISLIMPVDESSHLEVGLIGNEGMFGIPIALGVETSRVRVVVQGAGLALRMAAASFRIELERSGALQAVMDRYVFVHLSQLAQATACTRFHVVEERLARCLLMTQDRVHANSFHLTQELLASILGVRRVGVTKAASSLQERGMIHYSRGDITVLDRRALKGASCGCYKADRESYNRAFA